MIPLEVVIERRYFKPTYCIGKLLVEGMELSDSLEDKDRGLTRDMSTAEIYKHKVYGSTAIPCGRYEMRLSVSPKFKTRSWAEKYDGLVPEILDVPGFSNIRIHPGTTCADTDGCPLPGMNKAVGKVLESQKAYFDLMDFYLKPAHDRGQKMFITITKI